MELEIASIIQPDPANCDDTDPSGIVEHLRYGSVSDPFPASPRGGMIVRLREPALTGTGPGLAWRRVEDRVGEGPGFLGDGVGAGEHGAGFGGTVEKI